MRHKLVIVSGVFLASAIGGCKKKAEDKPKEPAQVAPTAPGSAAMEAPADAAAAVVEKADSPVPNPVVIPFDKVDWKPAPPSLPAGAMIALVDGTPPFSDPKTFSILLKMPKNYTIPPHTHPANERVTVLKGTLNVGHGDKTDKKATKALTVGGWANLPANQAHWVWNADETIVQLQGVGPWELYYGDAKNDTRQPPVAAPATPTPNAWDAKSDEVIMNAADVKYGPAPEGMLPAGAQMAVLEGAPDQPKTFTVRLKFPKGYKIPPHTHTIPDRGTVVAGALKVAMGADFDAKALSELPTGSTFVLPPGAPHYGLAEKGEVVLQVHGVGPFDIAFVHPEDKPGAAGSGAAGSGSAAGSAAPAKK